MTREQYKGHLAVICANTIFGLNMPIAKALLSEWMTPLGFTLSRMLFASAVFWLLSLFTRKEKMDRKDLIIIAIGGFFGLVATQFSFALGLQYTSPVNFSLIVALSPMVVMFMAALFLKEPITRKKVFGVLLGISGAALLVLHANGNNGGSDNMLGILFAFINITCYSVYLIITRTISQKYSAITLMKWMFLFTSIMLLPFGIGELPEQRIYSSEITTTAFLELAFILVCSTTIAYFLMPIALKRLRATTVSIYMNLQPIIASTVAIFIGQDIFTWDKPLAAILVIAGAYIVTQSVSRKDIEKAEGYKKAGG